MTPLDRIQRISGMLRLVLLVAAVLLAGALALALVVPGQTWVTLGDGTLNKLRDSGAISPGLMAAIAAPFVILLALGVYWLQRLFSEYQRGNFFTNSSMRCYVWLVWLKAASFVYGIIWPVLLRPAVDSAAVDSAAMESAAMESAANPSAACCRSARISASRARCSGLIDSSSCDS